MPIRRNWIELDYWNLMCFRYWRCQRRRNW